MSDAQTPSRPCRAGVDTLLEAVLQVTDVKSALAETGISVGQLEEAVREMRPGAATVDSQSGDQAFDVRTDPTQLLPPDKSCPVAREGCSPVVVLGYRSGCRVFWQTETVKPPAETYSCYIADCGCAG